MLRRNLRIVWVDDDPALTSQAHQNTIARAVAERIGHVCTLRHCRYGAEALMAIDDSTDILLFDWLYETATIDSARIVERIFAQWPRLPIVVYTAFPERVVKSPNIRAVLEKELDIEPLISTLSELSHDRTRRLLILSDLHFGWGHSRDTVFSKLAESLRSEARGFLSENRPDLILVCGDLTSQASRDEFAEARRFFLDLSEKLGVAPECFLFIPGNHDVLLTEDFAYNPFHEFLKSFYGTDRLPVNLAKVPRVVDTERISQDDLAWTYISQALGIVVIGLNSVQLTSAEVGRTSGRRFSTQGNILTPQLQRLSEAIKQIPPVLHRFALLHHQLFAVPFRSDYDRQSYGNDDSRVVLGQGVLLRWLYEHGTRVVFHGHSHFPAVRSLRTHFMGTWQSPSDLLHVISCGTSGSSALSLPFNSHHYGLLSLPPATELSPTSAVYTGRVLNPDATQWTSERTMTATLVLS